MAKTAAKSKSKSATPAKKAPAKPAAKKAAAVSKAKAPVKKAAAPAKPAAKKAAASPAKPAVKKAAPAPAKKVVKAAPKPKPAAKSVGRKEVAKPASKATAKSAAPAETVKAKVTAAAAAPRPKTTGVVAKARPRDPSAEDDMVMKPRKREAAVGDVRLPAGYKPSAKEEYMSPKQQEYFRLKLIKWREDLIEESQQTIDNLRDEVRDVGDEAERAQRETENSLELRTRDRYRKLLSQIDKALKRIEEGEYGYCEETGEPIGIDRLEVRPIARFSIDAQERWELRQKHMGE